MAAWLSGIIFLFCCEKIRAQGEKEFCPLQKLSEHCDRSINKEADLVGPVAADRIDCCAFLPLLFNKSRKLETAQTVPAPTAVKVIVTPSLPRIVLPSYEPITNYARLESRQGSYVLNRNFRI